MIPLHIIGDSHTRLYFSTTNRADPLVVQKEVMGPCECISDTCYCYAGMTLGGFSDDTATAQEKIFLTHLREYLGRVGRFENMGLVFGEVDVRWHVHNEAADLGIAIAIAKRVNIFRRFIEDEIRPRVSGKIVLFGGIPYTRSYSEAVNHPDGKLNKYAAQLDEMIGDMTEINGYGCLSIFNDVIGPDGFLDPKYLARDEHAQTMHLEPSLTAPIVAEKLRRIFE